MHYCSTPKSVKVICAYNGWVTLLAFYSRGEMMIHGIPWPILKTGTDMIAYSVNTQRESVLKRWPYLDVMVDLEQQKFKRRG